MKTITTIEELRTELENGKYGYYGIRGASTEDMDNLERGYLDCSTNFNDDEPIGKLNGTSAIVATEYNSDEVLIEKYNRAKNMYAVYTDTVLLIADKNSEYGVDDDEIILGSNGYGADVIAILNL